MHDDNRAAATIQGEKAARAGDEGRGFAVVATEVRTLAHCSPKAVRDIKGLIQEAPGRVGYGAGRRDRRRAFAEIVTGAAKVSSILDNIAAASREQPVGIEQVNYAVTALGEVTQQNAALVEEASAASRQMLELSEALVQQVTYFSVQPDGTIDAGSGARSLSPSEAGHGEYAMAGQPVRRLAGLLVD